MNHRKRSFWRKVAYLSVMAALLAPISWLGMPLSQAVDSGPPLDSRVVTGSTWSDTFRAAGRTHVLANLRNEKGIASSSLGDIDAGSETVKLATLGMHGLAVTILWERARHYQMTEDWTKLDNTLDQIRRLQPNYVSVWRYQAWNLSYNVSVEWDDYRERYYWVVQGINALDDGQRFNSDTRLFSDEGWFTGHKIGRSDEYRQFRVLFRDVDLIKFPEPWQPVEERDNWLYARQSTLQSIDLVERGGRLRGTSPVVFFSEPAKCTIRFTAAREEEGVFGERARYWWGRARNEWDAFGSRSIPSSFAGLIRLGELPKVESDMDALRAELDALVPGTRERLLEENINRLPPKEQRLMRSSIFELDAEEQIEQRRLNLQHRPTDHDVAHALPEKLHEQGHKLAERLALLDLQRRAMHSSRMTVNYSYWEDRCEAEASDDGLLARELLYDAHQAYRIDPMNAKEPYERAFEVWRRVLDRFPSLITDGEVGDDLIREARRYEYALKKHGLPFPDDFIIGAVLEERSISPPIGRYGEYRQRPLTPIAPPESPLEDLEGAPAATTPPATTPPGTNSPATPEPEQPAPASDPLAG